MQYDVLVVGAGVVGCAAAMELGKYSLRAAVIEAGEDVCTGTSKANSAIVHAGFDARPGSLMARFNVEGSHAMPKLCERLQIPFRRCEQVTEGEIVDAIHRVPGARSLDGVKRRTRAGMGRCQAGFCSPRVLEILSRELGVPQEQLTKSGGTSFPIVGKTRKDGENV